MSTNPHVDEFRKNMQRKRFKATVNKMCLALVDFGAPGQFSLDEKNLMFGVILQNWDRPDEEIATRLHEAGIDLGGGMSTPAQYVGYIKKRCQALQSSAKSKTSEAIIGFLILVALAGGIGYFVWVYFSN